MQLPDSYVNTTVSFQYTDWERQIEEWFIYLDNIKTYCEIEQEVHELLDIWENEIESHADILDLADKISDLFNSVAPTGTLFGLHVTKPYYGFFTEID